MGFGKFVKKKFGEAKEGIKKDIAYRVEVSKAAREAAATERKKQAISTAVSREKHRGSIARKRITAPRHSFGSGFDSFIGGTTSAPRAPTTRRKVTTYVKKGKGYVKKTSYRPVKNRAAVENNQDQFSNMFGSTTTKKKGGIPNLRL